MSEQWKPIPGYEPYEASDLGRIRRWHACDSETSRQRGVQPHHVVLKPRVRGAGHAQVGLRREGGSVYRHPSVLVLLAFVGPPPSPEHRAHHANGDASDDRLANLRWETGVAIARASGLCGEDSPQARFTNEQVRRMREEVRLKGRGAQAAIARRLGLRPQHVNDLVTGDRYAAAGPLPGPVNRTVTREQALDIIRRRTIGRSLRPGNTAALAAEYGISASNVLRIVYGLRKDVRAEALAARNGAR